MRLKIFFIAAALIYTHIVIACCIADELSEPEMIAQEYMTAFFHGNLERSFSLMHPDVLIKQKKAIVDAYETAKKEGNAEKFRQDFPSIDDLDSTLQLPAKDLFILLAQKSLENAPEQDREAMKKTVVEVIGSSSADNGTVRVSLVVTTPTPTGPQKQNAGLILRRYMGKWRVVKNAE